MLEIVEFPYLLMAYILDNLMTQMLYTNILLAPFCHCLLFFVIPPYDSTQSMRQLYQLCHPLAMLGLSLPVSRIYRCDQTLVQTTDYTALGRC